VPKGKVLDIGVGAGRNAMLFARMGYEVHGIDLSTTAIEKWKNKAKQENLHITAEVGNIHNYDIKLRCPQDLYHLR
jgi:2-polyprenyl-3-methyl-5-hydroxy-6-metoxy-1,4-benzoquinol methylase